MKCHYNLKKIRFLLLKELTYEVEISMVIEKCLLLNLGGGRRLILRTLKTACRRGSPIGVAGLSSFAQALSLAYLTRG